MVNWSIWLVIIAAVVALCLGIYGVMHGVNKKASTISVALGGFLLVTAIIRILLHF